MAVRFHSLDGLRAVAALSVVIAHHGSGQHGGKVYSSIMWAMAQISAGVAAVVAFFVLSAFILTYQLIGELETTGRINYFAFQSRRALRIWPVYIVAIFAVVMLPVELTYFWPADHRWLLDHWWLYAGFVSNWGLAFDYIGGYLDHSPPSLAILWTVAVEQQIYLILPLFAVLFCRGYGWVVVASCFAISIAARLLFPISSEMWNIYYNTLSYLDIVALGCAAGYAFRKYPEAMTRIFRFGIPTLIMGAAYYWMHSLGFQPAKLAWLYWIVGAFFASVIVYFVTHPESVAAKIFASKPLVYLGQISYGIYVWHVIANLMANSVTEYFGRGPTDSLILTLVICIAMADLTHRLIEIPMNKIRRREEILV